MRAPGDWSQLLLPGLVLLGRVLLGLVLLGLVLLPCIFNHQIVLNVCCAKGQLHKTQSAAVSLLRLSAAGRGSQSCRAQGPSHLQPLPSDDHLHQPAVSR